MSEPHRPVFEPELQGELDKLILLTDREFIACLIPILAGELTPQARAFIMELTARFAYEVIHHHPT